jgi:hypothetical protein
MYSYPGYNYRGSNFIPSNTVDTTSVTISPGSSLTGSSSFNWIGGVLAPNGLIYGISYFATNVCLINPITNTIDTTTVTISPGSSLIGNAQFEGGVLAPNGKIYGIPANSTNVLVIKTSIPTLPPWMLAPEFNNL